MKIRLLQMSIITIFIALSVFVYDIFIVAANQSYLTSSTHDDLYIQVGRNTLSSNSASEGTGNLITASSDLDFNAKQKISNVVYGNTLTSINGLTYFNNFSTISSITSEGITKVYNSTLDENINSLLFESKIEVVNAFATDDYYISVVNGNLQSTIGNEFEVSIITLIVNEERFDTIVTQTVDSATYDKENDEISIFFSNSQFNGVVSGSHLGTISSLKLSLDENGMYSIKEDAKKINLNVARAQILMSTEVVNNVSTIVYYTTELEGPYIEYIVYIANFNTKTNKINSAKRVSTQTYASDRNFDIKDCVYTEGFIFVPYSNLQYTKIDLEKWTSTDYIITDTGLVTDFSFDSDGEYLYMLALEQKEFKLFTIKDDETIKSKSVSKDQFGMGLLDFDILYDFALTKK